MNWLKKLFGFSDGGYVPSLSFDERYPNHKIVKYDLFKVGNPILENGKKWYPIIKQKKYVVTSESGEDISEKFNGNWIYSNCEIVEYFEELQDAWGYVQRSNASSESKSEIS